jgi:1-acyl-sn-glycerol-3-phosphate acyltransferase
MVRLAMMIFCRKLIINKPALLKEKGPLLLAFNHPNSFLDAIILDTLFHQSIYSLARGDVFKKPFYIKLLTALKMLPVYRISEGAENLSTNYDTFKACRDIFKKNGIVMIASEGKCINEWRLRPLKKGTARMAIASWEENIPLKVLPVGINYSSFRRFGKNIFINFGEMISASDIDLTQPDGLKNQAFNCKLEGQLKQLVFTIDKQDKEKQKKILEVKPSAAKKVLLPLPAFIGKLTHLPVYLPIRNFAFKKTSDNDHYDSVLIALLLFSYPLYLLLITFITFYFTRSMWALSILFLFPLTAWAYVQMKEQLDK